MSDAFSRRDGRLYAEQVPLDDIADAVGTPGNRRSPVIERMPMTLADRASVAAPT